MTKKRLAQIDKRIGKIKTELASIGQMRPGSLTRQYKDPGSASGAYYQLSYTVDMKSRTDYIPRNWLPQVRHQVANYKRFKSLGTEWVALSIERCRLTMKRMDRP